MDWDGKVGAPQALCAATGRVLAPGEQVYGVLVLREGGFARLDVAAEAWEGYDRTAALSWWRRTVPQPEKPKARIRLDPAALARIFADLAESQDGPRLAFRYIVGLCLLRARKLVLQRIEHEADGTPWLILAERGGDRHRLRDPRLRAEDEAGLTEQLLAVAAAGGGPLNAGEPPASG